MEKECEEMDGKSVKSGRSKKSGRSTKTDGVVKKQKKRNANGKMLDSDVDSRAGDFESDNSNLSAKVKELESEMEVNAPTFSEKYKEFKVDKGLQDRLEEEDTYGEWKGPPPKTIRGNKK